jgi:hypothetical protein
MPIVEVAQLRYLWIGFLPTILLAVAALTGHAASVVRERGESVSERVLESVLKRKLKGSGSPAPPETESGETEASATSAGRGNVVAPLVSLVWACGVAAVCTYVGFVFRGWGRLPGWLSWTLAVWMWWTAIVMVVVALKEAGDRLVLLGHPRVRRVLIISPIVVAGLVGVGLYAAWVYPKLPSYLGGGKETHVRLILDGRSVSSGALRQLGWGAEGDAADAASSGGPVCLVTERLKLHYTSKDVYLVAAASTSGAGTPQGPHAAVVALRKECVLALISAEEPAEPESREDQEAPVASAGEESRPPAPDVTPPAAESPSTETARTSRRSP